MEPTLVKWLWQGWIPLGKLTLLAGHPGEGKSTLTLWTAARVSRGQDMPNGTAGPPASHVVLLSAEDAAEDTIVPRLLCHGADLTRIHEFIGSRDANGREQSVSSLGDSDTLDAIEQLVEHVKARLVIIDPLSAFLKGIDPHKNAEIRSLLKPLADLAARTGCAVLLVEHLNKSIAQTVLHRVGGSVGLTAASRAVYLLGRHPQDASARVLWCAKNNLAPKPKPLTMRLGRDAQIEWGDGPDDFDPAAAVQELPSRPRSATRTPDSVRRVLVDVLHRLGPFTRTAIVGAAQKTGGGKRDRYFTELKAMEREGLIVKDGYCGKHLRWRLTLGNLDHGKAPVLAKESSVPSHDNHTLVSDQAGSAAVSDLQALGNGTIPCDLAQLSPVPVPDEETML